MMMMMMMTLKSGDRCQLAPDRYKRKTSTYGSFPRQNTGSSVNK